MLLVRLKKVTPKPRKLLLAALIAIAVAVVALLGIGKHIRSFSRPYMVETVSKVPAKYTALVLGAYVGRDGTPSMVLADRLQKALELYQHGKVKRFLLSGDHGRKDYDEVNNMKLFLVDRGVPECDIFLDHAGFDTYNSIVRAKEIFGVRELVIVTQEFHLSRAIFIARKKGLDAVGCVAEMPNPSALRPLQFREGLANVKAFWEVSINKDPKFFGPKIPITGNSRLSYD